MKSSATMPTTLCSSEQTPNPTVLSSFPLNKTLLYSSNNKNSRSTVFCRGLLLCSKSSLPIASESACRTRVISLCDRRIQRPIIQIRICLPLMNRVPPRLLTHPSSLHNLVQTQPRQVTSNSSSPPRSQSSVVFISRCFYWLVSTSHSSSLRLALLPGLVHLTTQVKDSPQDRLEPTKRWIRLQPRSLIRSSAFETRIPTATTIQIVSSTSPITITSSTMTLTATRKKTSYVKCSLRNVRRRMNVKSCLCPQPMVSQQCQQLELKS